MRASRPSAGEFDADEAVIVTSATRAVEDPAFRARVTRLQQRLAPLASVQPSGEMSRDGRATVLLLDVRGDVEPIAELVEASAGGGFETALIGGDSIDADFEGAAESDLARGETIGLGLALVVLLLVFGDRGGVADPGGDGAGGDRGRARRRGGRRTGRAS